MSEGLVPQEFSSRCDCGPPCHSDSAKRAARFGQREMASDLSDIVDDGVARKRLLSEVGARVLLSRPVNVETSQADWVLTVARLGGGGRYPPRATRTKSKARPGPTAKTAKTRGRLRLRD